MNCPGIKTVLGSGSVVVATRRFLSITGFSRVGFGPDWAVQNPEAVELVNLAF
jgi:hypothetical protein